MPTEILQRRRELYAHDPADFVAARDALVKELKAERSMDAAAQIARLRRPSVGAHALNQVARQHLDLIEAALDAGVALREASEAAAKGDARALRDATAAERAAAQAVAKEAKPLLGSRGEALVPALLATLRAGALDDDVAEQLRTGTLSSEHEQAGFGFGLDSGDGVVAPRRATTPAARKAAAKKTGAKPNLKAVPHLPEPDAERHAEQVAREKAERAEARAAERQRKKDHTAAERNAARLEREAARLAKEADEAEAEALVARQAADVMVERAAEARRDADALA